MTDSPITIATIKNDTPINELPELQPEQHYWALVDGSNPYQFIQDQSLFEAAVQENPKKLLVFPRGVEGELVWNGLPTSLSVLAAPPQQAAVVLVPRNLFDSNSGISVWEEVVDHTEHILIMQQLGTSHSPAAKSLPELAPRRVAIPKWLRKRCSQYLLPNVQSSPDAIAIKAGLFQIHGDLNTSHDFAQDCQGAGKYVAGDYWHGIMHRREPDYGNSKYWFRRVGDHPIFASLAEHANDILEECSSNSAASWQSRMTGKGWNPNVFVDLCETCERGNDAELTNAAKAIQSVEMLLLLKQTYLDAVA